MAEAHHTPPLPMSRKRHEANGADGRHVSENTTDYDELYDNSPRPEDARRRLAFTNKTSKQHRKASGFFAQFHHPTKDSTLNRSADTSNQDVAPNDESHANASNVRCISIGESIHDDDDVDDVTLGKQSESKNKFAVAIMLFSASRLTTFAAPGPLANVDTASRMPIRELPHVPPKNNAERHQNLTNTNNFAPADVNATSNSVEGTHTTKGLNIDLVAEDRDIHKYICISSDTTVDNLFARVQGRLAALVGGQPVQSLTLSIPEHTRNMGNFHVDADDPDTWKMFLKRAYEMDGSEIDVIGVVGL